MTDFAENLDFLMETQDGIVGGFGKWPDSNPGKLRKSIVYVSVYLIMTLNFFCIHSDE